MMKSIIRLCAAILLLILTPHAFGQTSPKIIRIDVKYVGPVSVSDDYVRANIQLKVGDDYLGPIAADPRLYDPRMDDDVKTLYATGLFYNIRVTSEQTPEGVILTYIVQPNPTLTDIRFEGNEKVKTSKLQKQIASKVGEPLSEVKLFTDKQDLEKYYQKMGYPNTTVDYVRNIDEEAGRATAVFEIKESPKVRIKRLEFEGVSVFPQKTLLKLFKTKRYHWYLSLLGKGTFKDEQFELDKDALEKYYRDHGYIDFEIKDVKFEYPDPKHMVIRIVVYEGTQYKVGAVSFEGADLFVTNSVNVAKRSFWQFGAKGTVSTNHPVDYLPLKSGNIYTPSGVSSNALMIQKFYESRGYIFDIAKGSTLRVVKTANTESNTIDVSYNLEGGEKSYVERIEIRGNTKTKDNVIRRELAITPGEVFDMTRVELSKRRLMGLDYFNTVDTRVETDPNLPSDRKNLIIGVEEKDTGNFSFGAGFSSVDSLVGFAELSQGNFDLFNPPRFTGGGQKLRLKVQLGTQRQDYTATLIEPWMFNRKLQGRFDIFHTESSYNSPGGVYSEEHTGFSMGLTRALGSDFLIGSVSYSLENVGIDFGTTTLSNGMKVLNTNVPPTLAKDNGYQLISKLGFSLAWDTRNSTQLPNKGQRTEISAEIASSYIGSENSFYKIELKSGWYFKGLYPGHVLEVVGRTGVADGLGNPDELPFFERYFLGGLDSMRGYEYRNVAPRDPGYDEPVGGKTYWFGSAEYSIPIIDRLRVALFYDIGEVQRDPYIYSFNNYNDNWGVGLRLNLPIGPLRIDYGVPITHDKYNSGAGRFQFGVGYSRQW